MYSYPLHSEEHQVFPGSEQLALVEIVYQGIRYLKIFRQSSVFRPNFFAGRLFFQVLLVECDNSLIWLWFRSLFFVGFPYRNKFFLPFISLNCFVYDLVQVLPLLDVHRTEEELKSKSVRTMLKLRTSSFEGWELGVLGNFQKTFLHSKYC